LVENLRALSDWQEILPLGIFLNPQNRDRNTLYLWQFPFGDVKTPPDLGQSEGLDLSLIHLDYFLPICNSFQTRRGPPRHPLSVVTRTNGTHRSVRAPFSIVR